MAAALATAVLERRVVAVVLLPLLAVLATRSRLAAVGLALVSLPLLGLVRRLTGGPDAYVDSDPLVVLPLLCLAVALTPKVLSEVAPRRQLLLGALAYTIAASGVLATVTGWGTTAVYGTAVNLLPLLAGVAIMARGELADRALGRWVAVLGGLASFAAGYGVLQAVSPPPWDLAWLASRQDFLVSVGVPEPGGFRIFSTMESPGALANFLGIACVAIVGRYFAVRRPGGLRAVAVALLLLLIVTAMALTAVRTALLAVPVAVLMMLVVSGRLTWRTGPLVVALGGATAVLLPLIFARTPAGRARYDLRALGDDQSLQDRLALLPDFMDALTGSPLGQGPGTSGIAAGLVGAGVTANLDNGYLVRLLETGWLGLVLFLLLVLRTTTSAFRGSMRRSPAAVLHTGVIVFFMLVELSGPLVSTTLGTLFWICLGQLSVLSDKTPGAARSPRRSDAEVVT